MDREEKRRAAEELASLRGDLEGPAPEGPNAALHAIAQFKRRQFQIIADLYAENFTEHALRAQLDFYRTDAGRSILAAEKAIRQQLPGRLSKLLQEINASGGGTLTEPPAPETLRGRRPK